MRAGVALVVSAGIAGSDSPALAGELDCRVISGQPLTISIITEASERRQVKLRTGDVLAFELQAGGGARGIVALAPENGPERALLDGPDGTKATFVASQPGSFDLLFDSKGGAPATFKATCRPAGEGRAEKRPKGAGRFARLPADIAIEVPVEDDDPTFADLAMNAPLVRMPNPEAPAFSAPTPKDPDTGLAFNMGLRDHRFVPGPYGVQVDPAASGVDIGVNYKLQPAIMVGAMAQFDQATETVIGGPARDMTDKAWMAGPVTKLKLAPGVALDAKAAWGYADASALDLSAHAPSMPRGLVSARLSNTQTFGGWRLTPSVNINHSWDTMVAAGTSATDAYVTSTVTGGRVDVGPELAYRLDLANAAFIEPRVAVGSFWGLDGLSSVTHPVHGDMRLKAEAGLTFGMGDGTKLQMGGAIEEGDRTVPDAWSGRVQMSVPLK
jgi:hypothetical protein